MVALRASALIMFALKVCATPTAPALLSWDTGLLGERELRPGHRIPNKRQSHYGPTPLGLWLPGSLPRGEWAGQVNRGENIILTWGHRGSEVGAFFKLRRKKQARHSKGISFIPCALVGTCVKCPGFCVLLPQGVGRIPCRDPREVASGPCAWAALPSSRACPAWTWRSWPK